MASECAPRAGQQFVIGVLSPEKLSDGEREPGSGHEKGRKQSEGLLAEAGGSGETHLYAGLNFGTLAFSD